MIADRSVIGVIPARGGSKGVPRKNIRPLAGKPLIAWTIEAARQSHSIDRLVLSSDDEEIIAIAEEWGCESPFLRPSELALDSTPTIDVVLHLLRELPSAHDYVVLLQPTSPLRTAADIDATIEHCIAAAAPSCVSLVVAEKSPYKMYSFDSEGRMNPLLPTSTTIRQQLPTAYLTNGAVYATQRDWLLREQRFEGIGAVGYVMPPERSLDIDTEIDFIVAAALLRHGNERSGTTSPDQIFLGAQ